MLWNKPVAGDCDGRPFARFHSKQVSLPGILLCVPNSSAELEQHDVLSGIQPQKNESDSLILKAPEGPNRNFIPFPWKASVDGLYTAQGMWGTLWSRFHSLNFPVCEQAP